MELQAKLLRVIEKRTIHKIGTLEEKKIDVRIIAATNKNLLERISQKEFRSDLFYRLNVVSINIPPLRKRRIDIPDLVDYYLHLHNKQYGTSKNIGAATQDVFLNYSWPGNVRELSNLMERAVITTRNNTISPKDLPPNVKTSHHPQPTPANDMMKIRKSKFKTLKQELDAHEKKILEAALNSFNTQLDAANELGISMSTLTRKLQKHKISLRNIYRGD